MSVIVFDQGTARSRDENGYLHVSSSLLTKEQVVPYRGREIPGGQALGLDPERVYNAYRPASELEKAVPSFNGLPILIKHVKDSAFDPQKALRVGATGTSAVFDGGAISNALVFHDAEAISRIESGEQKEISAGYRYDPVIQAGTFNGQHYDIIMTNIRGNHIAIVREGRAGPDVVVADESMDQSFYGGFMKLSQLVQRIVAKLRGNPAMAMDGDPQKVETLIGEAVKEVVDAAKAEGKEPVLELDGQSDVPSQEAAPAAAAPAQDTGAVAKDEGIVAKLKALLAPLLEGKAEISGKPLDAWLTELAAALVPASSPVGDTDPGMAKDVKTVQTLAVQVDTSQLAMDTKEIAANIHAEVTAQFKAKEAAQTAVAPLVGTVSAMAFDSAEDIYAYAVNKHGLDAAKYPRESLAGIVAGLVAAKRATAISRSGMAMDAKPKGELANADFSHVTVLD